MSDESFETEIKIFFNKTKLSDNIKSKSSILNEKKLSLQEENEIELNSKSKTNVESINISNTSNTSNSFDIPRELNFQFQKEPMFLFTDDDYSIKSNKKYLPNTNFSVVMKNI